MSDLIQYLDALFLTQLTVSDAVYHFPVFWTEDSSIDDEIIDFTQKGGWHRINSVGAFHKRQYDILVENFSQLTEGLKVRVGDLSLFYSDGN